MSIIQTLKSNIAELYRLLSFTDRQVVKDVINTEVKKIEDLIPIFQDRYATMRFDPQEHHDKPENVELSVYVWHQSFTCIKIYVTIPELKIIPTENVQCTFTKTSLKLEIKGLGSKNYFLSVRNFYRSVKDQYCSWRVNSDVIILTLPKQRAMPWSDLTKLRRAVAVFGKTESGNVDIDTDDVLSSKSDDETLSRRAFSKEPVSILNMDSPQENDEERPGFNSDDEIQLMTTEDMKKLYCAIKKLPGKELGVIVNIIKSTEPKSITDDTKIDEFEIKLDSYKPSTLKKIHSYVAICKIQNLNDKNELS